jgi:hypothetical protein
MTQQLFPRSAGGNRDRGEPRGSSPPTPPYIRVRIRRFARLSANVCFASVPEAQIVGFVVLASAPSDSTVRASPFRAAPKASDLDFQPPWGHEVPTPKRLSSVPSARLVSPTTPSADFCAAVGLPYDDITGTQHRPPEVRPTAFTARPPDLPPRPLMTLDFAIMCSLVRPDRPLYPVLVHRAADLFHAFFRPHLTMTPLRFANPSPSSGWIEDFHLQAVVHTRHTQKRPRLEVWVSFLLRPALRPFP